MPNINSLLKSEIARVARKEIRRDIKGIRSASSNYRSQIAALKKAVATLEGQLKRVGKAAESAPGGRLRQRAEDESSTSNRFSAKGLRSQRQRLGLTAEQTGKLIGVSALSIYNWESGKVRPREKYLPAVVALRTLGRKQAQEVLASR